MLFHKRSTDWGSPLEYNYNINLNVYCIDCQEHCFVLYKTVVPRVHNINVKYQEYLIFILCTLGSK